MAVARVLASSGACCSSTSRRSGSIRTACAMLARLIREQVARARRLGDRRHARRRARGRRRRIGCSCCRSSDRKLEQLFVGTLARRARGSRPSARGARQVDASSLEGALVDHLAVHGDTPPPQGAGAEVARFAASAAGSRRSLRRSAWRSRRSCTLPGQLATLPARLRVIARRVVAQTLVRPLRVLRDRVDADRLHGAVRDQQGRRRGRAPRRAAQADRRQLRRRARAGAVGAAVRRRVGQRDERVARLDGADQADARARRARRRSPRVSVGAGVARLRRCATSRSRPCSRSA